VAYNHIFFPESFRFSHQCAIVRAKYVLLFCIIKSTHKSSVMKKSKYIDYNILLACLSKRPQATSSQPLLLIEKRDIVEEFYEALSTMGEKGISLR
jgi:hypothetical protein